MANDIGGNPWVIDTASANVIFSGNIKILRLVWHEPTTAGHNIEVLNKTGRTVWSKDALAGGAGLDYSEDVYGWVKGLKVTVLDSGVLFVHVG